MTRYSSRRYRLPRPGPLGFTLIELLLVVVLIGIIALLAFPLLGDRDGDRVRGAARLLVADLEYAQLRSIGDGDDPCVVVLDQANHRYHLAKRSSPATPITDPGTGDDYTTDFGQSRAWALDGVTIDSLEAVAGDQLAFTSMGSLDQPADATVVLRCGERTIRVVVESATGEPRVE